MTPDAKNAVKLMPIAASGLVLLLEVIKTMNKLASIPVIRAPINIGMLKRNDKATPGRTAWLIASPIKDSPRNTMILPIVPQTTTTKIEVIQARFKNW